MSQESSTSSAAPDLTNLPSNPEDFEKWAVAVSQQDEGANSQTAEGASATSGATGEQVGGTTTETVTEVKTEGQGTTTVTEVATGTETQVEQPQGVLAKDGKTVIPYTVLANSRKETTAERQARIAAEARATELEQEIAKLKAGGNATETNADETDALIKQIEEQIGDSVPEVAGPLKAIVERLQAQSREITALREQRVAQVERREDPTPTEGKSEAELVQDAIDANPKLLYLQNERPDLFEAAVEQDRILRGTKAGSALSLGERFSRVVTAVEALHGAIEVPSQYLPKAPQPSRENEVRTEVKPAEQEKLPVLSNLPGGAPPVRDDRRFDEMTVTEVASEVDRMIAKGMSPQELAAALGAGARIG